MKVESMQTSRPTTELTQSYKMKLKQTKTSTHNSEIGTGLNQLKLKPVPKAVVAKSRSQQSRMPTPSYAVHNTPVTITTVATGMTANEEMKTIVATYKFAETRAIPTKIAFADTQREVSDQNFRRSEISFNSN